VGPCTIVWNERSHQTFSPSHTPGDEDLAPGVYGGHAHIRENHVFLLGDNFTESIDSRSFGERASSELTGKVLAVLYPFRALKAVR
jgi:hypothetical protein